MDASDHFGGISRALRKKGHAIHVLCGDTFFVPYKLEMKTYKIIRTLRKIISNLPIISHIDAFFYSILIGFYCKKHSIKLVYSELEQRYNPKVSRLLSPGTFYTQWVGIFPWLLNSKQEKYINFFDIIWSPAIYQDDVDTQWLLKSVYVGNVVDPELFKETKKNKDIDILFYGGLTEKHSERREILESICENFTNFAFYGYGIDRIKDSSCLHKAYRGWAPPHTIPDLISRSKIVINLTLNDYTKVKKGFNCRLLEIAATGSAVQIIKRDSKISDFLSMENSVITYDTKTELIEKIRMCLSDYEKYQCFIKNAQEEASKHNYNRLLEIIECTIQRERY